MGFDVRPFSEYALPSPDGGNGDVKVERECEKRCNDERKCRSFNFSPFYQTCELLTTDVTLQHISSTGCILYYSYKGLKLHIGLPLSADTLTVDNDMTSKATQRLPQLYTYIPNYIPQLYTRLYRNYILKWFF